MCKCSYTTGCVNVVIPLDVVMERALTESTHKAKTAQGLSMHYALSS